MVLHITDDGELYMWGKNSSQVIRDDENSRFFQFEPRLVPLGVWRALKVSTFSFQKVEMNLHVNTPHI